MSRKTIVPLIFGLIASLLFASVSWAAPGLPAQYYGEITINGANAPLDTVVAAYIDGTSFEDVTVTEYNGTTVFSILVPGDDPDTAAREGGRIGDTVVLMVNGEDVGMSATWSTNGPNQLDMTIDTTQPPEPPQPGDGDGTFIIPLIGSLVVSIQDVLFPSRPLTGVDFSITADASNWAVSDRTGTGAGYVVNLSASGDFANEYGETIPLNGLTIQMDDSGIQGSANSGTAPASLVTSPQTVSTTGLDILQAAVNTGNGEFTFTPSFSLFVPGDTEGGTYLTTVYVTITAGP